MDPTLLLAVDVMVMASLLGNIVDFCFTSQFRRMQIGPGMIQQVQMACRDCDGEGEIILPKDRCKQCNGRKKVSISCIYFYCSLFRLLWKT